MIIMVDGQFLINGLLLNVQWGVLISFEFLVGIFFVNYILIDVVGNVIECGFMVMVNDEEDLEVMCLVDIMLQLGFGECEIVYILIDLVVMDNCGDFMVVVDFLFEILLLIGVMEVMLMIIDEVGNEVICIYEVIVLEYVLMDLIMLCIEEINVLFGFDCMMEILLEMVLMGNDYYCYDNYELMLFDSFEGNLLLFLFFVIEEYIGQIVVVEVCDLVNDICCWGYVNVGFYEVLEFECFVDIVLSCIDVMIFDVMGELVLLFCVLGGVDIFYMDVVEENGNCGDFVLLIECIWIVVDVVGNSIICMQVIMVEIFDLVDIEFLLDWDGVMFVVLDCSEVVVNLNLIYFDNMGYLMFNGSIEVFGVNYCSVLYFYMDEIFNICVGSYEILWIWKVCNMCLLVVFGENFCEYIQFICVLDQLDLEVLCFDDQIISISLFSCMVFYLVLVLMMMSDGCLNIMYMVLVSGGVLIFDGISYSLSNLVFGNYIIIYCIIDECNCCIECSYVLMVEDLVEFVVICNDLLQISFGG